MKLDPNTINELVVLLKQFMEDEQNRRPFLVLALGNDAPVLQRITWSGAVAAFIPDMVCKLADYGELEPGRQALWALLEYVRSQAGIDVQQCIDKLRPLIDLRSPLALGFAQSHSCPPTDTSSSVETPDIDVLVQKVRSRLHDKIQRLHGTMQLLDVARPVEIDRLYVDVNILTEPTSYSRLEIDDLLAGRDYRRDFNRFGLSEKGERVAGLKAVVDYPKLMVLGKPGSGKTTFLQHIVIECNNGNLLTDCIPILIKLREFVKEARKLGDFGLRRYLCQELQGCSEQEIEALLQEGKVLMLLDGLDEVCNADGDEVVDQVEWFARNYDQNHLIITCRIQAQKYRFERFAYVEVADFNSEQIAAFARKWFVATARNGEQERQDQAEQFIETLNLPENQKILDLAVTPILLSLSCKVFSDKSKFYSKPAELYKQGLNLLLFQWDERRRIARDKVYRDLSVTRKQELLSYLATRKFEQEQYVLFEQDEIQGYIADFLDISSEESQAVLESIEAQHGLLVERAQLIYSFSHLTFQEYFTAKWFVDHGDWQGLASHIIEEHWREVFLLAVGMMKPVDKLLQLMKQEIDRHIGLDEKLQQFLYWLSQKSSSVNLPYKPAAIRAFYLNQLDPDIDISFGRSEAIDSDFNKVSLDKYRVFDTDFDYRNWELVLDCTLHLDRCPDPPEIALALFLVPNLGQALQKLSDQVSDRHNNREKFDEWWIANGEIWREKYRSILIKYRNIGHKWQFSVLQKRLLEQYCYINMLLVDCLNSGCVVSDRVREEIEETLLLPIAEIENRRGTRAEW